jgi:hypothetical protein
MYAHKLDRFYYTTYDVRCSEDVINPRTSHCDVMLLGPQAEGMSKETPPHRFLYARVLGIYHVNVVYTGPCMVSYELMKFDFLWVRWFNVNLDATYSIKRLRRASCEVFTLPHVFRAESERCPSCPRTVRGLNSD